MSNEAAERGETFALPTGTVTFLLTDIAGSTRGWEDDPQAMAKAVARHYDLIAEAVGRYGGVRPVEQGEGDSVVAAFSRASDALAAAVDAQMAFGVEPWPEGAEIAIRIGLHTGEAQLRDEGNYFGQAVNRCARLRTLAHGGQVVVSRAVHDLVADRLPAGVGLRDLGTHRLRDLGRPEHVFQVVHSALRDDFPPLVSLDAVPNNLPIQLTTFVGRDRELQELRRLLDSSRLVTLTGSGGCGKTRLALQTAVERLDRHVDGVWYIELAPVGETTSVARVVADVLRIADEPDRSVTATLTERLRDRDLLVVLDNCEHLLAEATSLTDALLRACPQVRLLTTSRQPLNVAGEAPWRVPSLDLPGGGEPEPIDALGRYDAVRLFVDRATRARSNFRLTDRNSAAVVQLCRRLDGIPLAIELAAALSRALTPEQILTGLDDRFRLLTGGAAALLPRQQTLRASVDWSHNLLDDGERTLFRRLSTFSGGFTLDAAEAVCAAEGLETADILTLLAKLVDRSLVLLDDVGAEPRYALLETIKEYGRERLEEAGEDVGNRDRHLDHFAALVRQTAPALLNAQQGASLDRLLPDHDNMRAALEWADASLDAPRLLQMAIDLTFFWFLSGQFKEGDGWLHRAIGDADQLDPQLRSQACWGRAYLNFYGGDLAAAYEIAVDAKALAEAAGDDATVARALDTIGSLMQLSEPEAALPLLREAADRALAQGDDYFHADSLQKCAWCHLWQDRYDPALPLLDEALVVAQRLGSQFLLAWHWIGCGWVEVRRGDLPVARRTLVDAARAADVAREPMTTIFAAWFQAEVELQAGEYMLADSVLSQCDHDLQSRGMTDFHRAYLGSLLVRARMIGGNPPNAEDVDKAVALLAGIADDGALVIEGHFLPVVAEALITLGALDRASAIVLRHLEVAGALDNPLMLGWSHGLLARADRAGGDIEAAESHAHEALARFADHGFGPDAVDALELLAVLAADDQSWTEAARLRGATERIRAERGWHRWPLRAALVASADAAIDAALGVDEVAGRRTEGAALDLDGAVAYVRRARGTRGRPAAGWRSLTPTELEVVRLVAEGLTNPQIGERLFIARATVKAHLAHVFSKLDVTSRSELASEATRRGL